MAPLVPPSSAFQTAVAAFHEVADNVMFPGIKVLYSSDLVSHGYTIKVPGYKAKIDKKFLLSREVSVENDLKSTDEIAQFARSSASSIARYLKEDYATFGSFVATAPCHIDLMDKLILGLCYVNIDGFPVQMILTRDDNSGTYELTFTVLFGLVEPDTVSR